MKKNNKFNPFFAMFKCWQTYAIYGFWIAFALVISFAVGDEGFFPGFIGIFVGGMVSSLSNTLSVKLKKMEDDFNEKCEEENKEN